MALAASLTCLAIYLFTLAPGVTAEDSGLITLAAAHAIPAHPPGYMLNGLLGWLWLRPALWIGADPARWLAALSALLSSVAVYHFCRSLAWRAPARVGLASSWLAGLAFGCGGGVWSQAVIVEVYALGLLELALAYRVWRWAWSRAPDDVSAQGRALAGLVLIAGLGLHSHHAVVAITTVLALALLLRGPGLLRRRRTWALGAAALLPSMALVLVTTWRANAVPDLAPRPIHHLADYWDLLSRATYQAEGGPMTSLRAALDAIVLAVQQDGGVLLVGLALLGLALALRERSTRAATLWELAALALYALLVFVQNPFTDTLANRQINAVLLYPWGLWLAAWMGRALAQHQLRPGLAGAAAIALTLALVSRNAGFASARDDTLAMHYVDAVALSAPPGAAVICSAEQDAFPLVYAQALRGWRPDLRIVEISHPRWQVPGLPTDAPLRAPSSSMLQHLERALPGRPLLLTQVFYAPPPEYRAALRGVLLHVWPRDDTAALPALDLAPLLRSPFFAQALRPDPDADRVWHISRAWYPLLAFAAWLAQDSRPLDARVLIHVATQARTQLGLTGYFTPRLIARDPTAARVFLERLYADAADSPELAYHLALVEQAQGRCDAARARLQGLVDRHPTEVRFRALLAELDARPSADAEKAATPAIDAGRTPGVPVDANPGAGP